MKFRSGLWQLAQLMVPSMLKRLSRNKDRPSCTSASGWISCVPSGGSPRGAAIALEMDDMPNMTRIPALKHRTDFRMSIAACLMWLGVWVPRRVCHDNNRGESRWRKSKTAWAISFLTAFSLTPLVHSWLGIHVTGGLIEEARADNITYAYDGLGRLIQATDFTTQQAIIYIYDSVGDIVSQQTVPLTTLAVSGFSSAQGAPGSQLTIDGTGFSSTPGANTVLINGEAATVVSATSTQLIVDVPAGATVGPITITTGAATVTSANNFAVQSGGAAPTITSFSPAIGASGTVVTVNGSGFQSTVPNNGVQFNQTWAHVSATTATALTTSVPAGGTSGPIAIETPYGQAISATNFIVPPPDYAASAVASGGNLILGSPKPVPVSSPNVATLLTFNGTKGLLLAIGISADTIASSTIKVYDPIGNLITSAVITASGQGLQVPALARDGTYTVVVDAGASTGTLTLDLVGPVQGTLTQNGSALPIALSVPGQAAQLTFSGTQGAFVSLELSGVTITSGTVNILDPSGSMLVSGSLTTAGLALQPELPVSGTYTVQVIPNGAIAGSLKIGRAHV